MSGEDEGVVEAERVKLQLQDVVVLQNLKLSGWNYWTSLGGMSAAYEGVYVDESTSAGWRTETVVK